MAFLGGLDRFTGGLLDSPTMQLGMGLLGSRRGLNFGQSLRDAADRSFDQRRLIAEEQNRNAQLAQMQYEAILAEQARQQELALAEQERQRQIGAMQRGAAYLQNQMPGILGAPTPEERQRRLLETRMGVLQNYQQAGVPVPQGVSSLLGPGGGQNINVNTGGGMDFRAKNLFEMNRDVSQKWRIANQERMANMAAYSSTIDRMLETVDQAGTGPAPNLRLNVAQVLSMAGVDPARIEAITAIGDVRGAEMYHSALNEATTYVLGLSGQTLGPYSDRDMDLMKAIQGAASYTPEGNKLILKNIKYMLARNRATSDFIEQQIAASPTLNMPNQANVTEFATQWSQQNREKYLGKDFTQRAERLLGREKTIPLPADKAEEFTRDYPGWEILRHYPESRRVRVKRPDGTITTLGY